ncbi:hypothetical protein FHS96_003138 [Sphingomonas zeicaulis]|uniref:DUF1489 domain-containing protein n=1 Tax=Sphingomonas zeicaulis TaxID=1632740 RepID=UPI003D19814B
MPLSMTKIAYGCESLEILAERIAMRAGAGEMQMTTRYLPKRHAEMLGGSLYWIIRHNLVARCPLIGFAEAEDGKHTIIRLEPVLIPVRPRPKRAHQGWRYLEEKDAPPDLGTGAGDVAALPAGLAGDLEALGLI